MLGAMLIQFAATLAVPAFHAIGPAATSAWRFFLGAVVLLALVRPKVRAWTRRQWLAAATLGIATAAMNQSFYQAIARIHLGAAVAIEYLGPFVVAVLIRPTWRHTAFVLLAAAGVLALTRPGSGITWMGALFAVGAGVGWASYTLASHRVGGVTQGFEGLAVAMTIAAVVTWGFAASSLRHVATTPSLAGRLATMAILAIVLGFGAELQALRRLRPATVGVLLALNPAVALLMGAWVLHQSIAGWDVLGVVLVVAAGVAVTRSAAESPAIAAG